MNHCSLWEMGKREAKRGKNLHYPPSALQLKSSLDPLNKSDEFETACTYILRDVFTTRRRRLRLLKFPFSIKVLISIPFRISFDPCRKMEGGLCWYMVDPKGLSNFKF